MKKTLLNWILPSFGALSIALSIIAMIPGIAQAQKPVTVRCGNGSTVTCYGLFCNAEEGIGCSCSNGVVMLCPPLE